jgi:hypothetical protein
VVKRPSGPGSPRPRPRCPATCHQTELFVARGRASSHPWIGPGPSDAGGQDMCRLYTVIQCQCQVPTDTPVVGGGTGTGTGAGHVHGPQDCTLFSISPDRRVQCTPIPSQRHGTHAPIAHRRHHTRAQTTMAGHVPSDRPVRGTGHAIRPASQHKQPPPEDRAASPNGGCRCSTRSSFPNGDGR